RLIFTRANGWSANRLSRAANLVSLRLQAAITLFRKIGTTSQANLVITSIITETSWNRTLMQARILSRPGHISMARECLLHAFQRWLRNARGLCPAVCCVARLHSLA